MNIRFVRGVHDAMGTGLEFRRPRRGETTPSKNRGFARRLGLEQLEARQMLTATLLHTLNNPEPASVMIVLANRSQSRATRWSWEPTIIEDVGRRLFGERHTCSMRRPGRCSTR